MICLVDSNILIYYINQQLSAEAASALQEAVTAGAGYSSITRIEVMGWSGHTPQSRQSTQAVLDVMRELHKIKLPDAVIAATALTHRLPLMTRNRSDFSSIALLQCL